MPHVHQPILCLETRQSSIVQWPQVVNRVSQADVSPKGDLAPDGTCHRIPVQVTDECNLCQPIENFMQRLADGLSS